MTLSVATIEADVIAIIAKIKTGIATIEADFDTAAKWVAQEVPIIVPYIEQVIGFASSVGVASNPEVMAAITAANTAVQGLNAFAAAENSGVSDTASVVAAYTAIKNAQAASASAASTVAQSPPAAAAVAPVAAPASS